MGLHDELKLYKNDIQKLPIMPPEKLGMEDLQEIRD